MSTNKYCIHSMLTTYRLLQFLFLNHKVDCLMLIFNDTHLIKKNLMWCTLTFHRRFTQKSIACAVVFVFCSHGIFSLHYDYELECRFLYFLSLFDIMYITLIFLIDCLILINVLLISFLSYRQEEFCIMHFVFIMNRYWQTKEPFSSVLHLRHESK